MNLKTWMRAATAVHVATMIGCAGSTDSRSESRYLSSYAEKPHNFRLSLTDAPNDDLTAVVVNIKHAELRVSGGGKEARVIAAENLGPINLLDLQNGVTLPMEDMQLPAGVRVTQIRLVLNETGHYIMKGTEERCDLKTPSAQKTGVKILIHQGIAIDNGYNYSVVVDFDAKKSIVQTGNGGCLLKPVLKLKSATRIDVVEEPVVPDDGSSQDGDDTGFDDGTDTGIPEVPTEDLDDYLYLIL